MLRTALFAAALMAAILSPAARADVFVEGRVIAVAPHLALSFGSLRHDGFRIDYEFGGERYVTYRDVRPGRVILVPPPVRVVHVDPGHRHWRDHDRWDDRRHWRDDRRGHRHGHRHGRGHGRGHDH